MTLTFLFTAISRGLSYSDKIKTKSREWRDSGKAGIVADAGDAFADGMAAMAGWGAFWLTLKKAAMLLSASQPGFN